jgi:hypothetical protein
MRGKTTTRVGAFCHIPKEISEALNHIVLSNVNVNDLKMYYCYKVFVSVDHNIIKTAEILGINRSTIVEWLDLLERKTADESRKNQVDESSRRRKLIAP